MPDAEIQAAVARLRAGELVGIPTETVYGLGADAENDDAVARIFAVKRRPRNHPLIVHLALGASLDGWVSEATPDARVLAKAFWPGPLTMILPRGPRSHLEVTGGQNTVAVRVPAHPVAQQLLRAFGGGIAAPSANRFGSVSPTTAQHVRDDLGHDVACVLDGGPCGVGIESTIVDLSRGRPILLRPGSVSREQLSAVLGREVEVNSNDAAVRVSGQLESHYAPRARVEIVERESVAARERAARDHNERITVLDASGINESIDDIARNLYENLRQADLDGIERVLVILPTDEGLGLAVRDRLMRAAGPR
ncbi:MAG: threonylcarbamoyl-AMP synthase [Sandaracinaceae bacterium]|nr:threonylcarbamoyl-AMP synthase [Sandaracinaceae bacterium]